MREIAVIDTETNWQDRVMSLGVVTADRETYSLRSCRYYIFTPEYRAGGMYADVLDLVKPEDTILCSREAAMADLVSWLKAREIRELFAYNARFDCSHLRELEDFRWFDIMRLAAYRQYNSFIPDCAPCCSTGRLRSRYGVEPIIRLLTGDPGYRETHNALYDAADELSIMRCLGLDIQKYQCAEI